MHSTFLTRRCLAAAAILALPALAFAGNTGLRAQAELGRASAAMDQPILGNVAPTNGPQLYTVHVPGNENKGVQIFDADGNLLQRSQADADGNINVAGLPGQKFFLLVEEGATAGLGAVGKSANFAIPFDGSEPIEAQFASNSGAKVAGQNSCATAAPLTVGISVFGDTTTSDNCDGCIGTCGTSAGTGGVDWWSFTGTGNDMRATTCTPGTDGGFDTKLHIYRNCTACSQPVECIDGNDDNCSGGNFIFHSTVTFDSNASTEYMAVVMGFGADEGVYELLVSDLGNPQSVPDCPEPTGACCDCRGAPFNCTADVTVGQCDIIGGEYLGDYTSCLIPLDRHDHSALADGSPDVPSLGFGTGGSPGGQSVSSTITVADATDWQIFDLDIGMDIDHTFVGDMILTMTYNGNEQEIWSGVCGSWDDIHTNIDEEGTNTLCTQIGDLDHEQSLLEEGVYMAFGNLFSYDGMFANGDWNLDVTDTWSPTSSGTLEDWQIQEQGSEPACEGGGGGGASS